jgi:hypothetical protein
MPMVQFRSAISMSKWHEIKNKLKYQYEHLTQNDFEYIRKEKPKIIGELQSRCGYSKYLAEKAVNNFFVFHHVKLSNH